MSTKPEPQPDSRSESPSEGDPGPGAAPETDSTAGADQDAQDAPPAPETRTTASPARPAPRSAAALIFDDPLSRRSSDDTDHGWGERPATSGSAADLARFLDEKPPHHL
ncbi:hypothetical protein ACFU7T_20235 [Streptomyces sp. NPDC057555]|uniref:hypothetical protein n=1 Tax=Streptomyces sp. NPDC057555 TaxID=3346166 RepID=UPI0036BE6566